MKNYLVIILLSLFTTVVGKTTVVTFAYQQEDVHLMVDNRLYGRQMTKIKIDFNLVKELKFFKNGYYSKTIKIGPKTTVVSYDINLESRPDTARLAKKYLISPTPLIVTDIVTNFTEDDLGREIKNNFKESNILLGSDINSFPSEKKYLNESNLVLNVEIIKNQQINGFYVAPYFNMAGITIKWTLINTISKEIVYNKEITTNYFVRYTRTYGLLASDELRKVVVSCIQENQLKLVSDPEFKKLF